MMKYVLTKEVKDEFHQVIQLLAKFTSISIKKTIKQKFLIGNPNSIERIHNSCLSKDRRFFLPKRLSNANS